MSVNEKELQNFAKLVATHEAFPEVIKRIKMTLFERWITADDDQRMVIGDIANNMALFIAEISRIYESIDDDKPINEE